MRVVTNHHQSSATTDALSTALSEVAAGRTLGAQLAQAAMLEIMDGRASDTQIAGLLVGLASRGETIDEIAGFARTMAAHAVPVEIAGRCVDTCGTGGDGSNSFNISTAAAFVVAGSDAQITVAKHGNRASSSRCGSADVLEALGARIELEPDEVTDIANETGFAFMFAPRYHPAMRHAMPVRRALAVRTVFNLLGPLTNPARARHQVLGVPRPDLVPKLAAVLAALGTEHALVVCGRDGLDEISISAPTLVAEVRNGAVVEFELDPRSLGIALADARALAGDDADANARIVRNVLAGECGPRRDVVALNAAAALVAADHAADFAQGLAMANDAIASGGALATLDAFVEASNRVRDKEIA